MAVRRSAADDAEAHGLAAAARFTCQALLSGSPWRGGLGAGGSSWRAGARWAPAAQTRRWGRYRGMARPARGRRAGRWQQNSAAFDWRVCVLCTTAPWRGRWSACAADASAAAAQWSDALVTAPCK